MNDLYIDDSGYSCYEPEVGPDYNTADLPGYDVQELEFKNEGQIAQLLSELTGKHITGGYIGNLYQRYDDRLWYLFGPRADSKIGGYSTMTGLIVNFTDNPQKYIEWAKSH